MSTGWSFLSLFKFSSSFQCNLFRQNESYVICIFVLSYQRFNLICIIEEIHRSIENVLNDVSIFLRHK